MRNQGISFLFFGDDNYMKFFSSLEDGFQNPYKFKMDFHKVMIQMKLH
jgi:hypothetical protein